MNDLENNILVVNLAAYTEPLIDIKNSQSGYVEFGEDNLYPQYIDYLARSSTTNESAISGITRAVYGKGIAFYSDDEKDPILQTKFNKILTESDLSKFVLDYKIHGYAAFQVIYLKKKVKEIKHIIVSTLRAGVPDENNNINSWFFNDDWEEDPSAAIEYPAFGTTNNSKTEIFVLKSYNPSNPVYTLPDYQSALPYAVLEDEIGDFLINDIKNGFSGTKLINLNNGVPDAETRHKIKAEIINNVTGSRGNKVIVAFNKSAETATTIDDIPLDDAPNHYEFLAQQCENKLLVGHKITSPLLLGIKTGNSGLGNNADEIKNAYILQDSTLIRPIQTDILVNAIIPLFNNTELTINKDDIYFVTVTPIEFMNAENLEGDAKEEKTGVKEEEINSTKLAKENIINIVTKFNKEELNKDQAKVLLKSYFDVSEIDIILGIEDKFNLELFNELIKDLPTVEEALQDYWVIDEYNNDEYTDNTELINTALKRQNLFQLAINLVKTYKTSTGIAKPDSSSKLDQTLDNGDVFQTRFRYTTVRKSEPKKTRAFCRNMLRANKLYRKEDIDRMSKREVNEGFAPKGKIVYDILKYKGGVNCGHVWFRVIRLKKLKGESIEMARDRAVNLGYKRIPLDKDIFTAPYYMDDGGRLNKSK